MNWLTNICVVAAKLAMFVVILAWVVLGHIKPSGFSQPLDDHKGSKALGSGERRSTDPASI